jgi:hypothetical protein
MGKQDFAFGILPRRPLGRSHGSSLLNTAEFDAISSHLPEGKAAPWAVAFRPLRPLVVALIKWQLIAVGIENKTPAMTSHLTDDIWTINELIDRMADGLTEASVSPGLFCVSSCW